MCVLLISVLDSNFKFHQNNFLSSMICYPWLLWMNWMGSILVLWLQAKFVYDTREALSVAEIWTVLLDSKFKQYQRSMTGWIYFYKLYDYLIWPVLYVLLLPSTTCLYMTCIVAIYNPPYMTCVIAVYDLYLCLL